MDAAFNEGMRQALDVFETQAKEVLKHLLPTSHSNTYHSTRPAAVPATGKGAFPRRLEGAHPRADKATIDTNGFSGLDPALARAHYVHCDTAQFGLGRWRGFTEITFARHSDRRSDAEPD